jgi:hypothetical protein
MSVIPTIISITSTPVFAVAAGASAIRPLANS